MRINVYSQEITNEVKLIEKLGQDKQIFSAVQLMLHSSDMLHQPPNHVGDDDDRSAVTLWLPRSDERREQLARTFSKMAELVRQAKPEVEGDYKESLVDREAVIQSILKINPSEKECPYLSADGLIHCGEDRQVEWVPGNLSRLPTRFLVELLEALKTKSVRVEWARQLYSTTWFKEWFDLNSSSI